MSNNAISMLVVATLLLITGIVGMTQDQGVLGLILSALGAGALSFTVYTTIDPKRDRL